MIVQVNDESTTTWKVKNGSLSGPGNVIIPKSKHKKDYKRTWSNVKSVIRIQNDIKMKKQKQQSPSAKSKSTRAFIPNPKFKQFNDEFTLFERFKPVSKPMSTSNTHKKIKIPKIFLQKPTIYTSPQREVHSIIRPSKFRSEHGSLSSSSSKSSSETVIAPKQSIGSWLYSKLPPILGGPEKSGSISASSTSKKSISSIESRTLSQAQKEWPPKKDSNIGKSLVEIQNVMNDAKSTFDRIEIIRNELIHIRDAAINEDNVWSEIEFSKVGFGEYKEAQLLRMYECWLNGLDPPSHTELTRNMYERKMQKILNKKAIPMPLKGLKGPTVQLQKNKLVAINNDESSHTDETSNASSTETEIELKINHKIAL